MEASLRRLAHTELQLQNNIIMFARPTYPYVGEINGLSEWYEGETIFHQENKIRWMFDAIKLRRDINGIQDIAANFIFS